MGYAIRQVGSQVAVTAVIYQVFALTHSNLAVGLVSVAQLAPTIVVPLFGGALADAVDRRKLLIVTALLLGACTTGLALNTQGGHPRLWLIYVLSSLSWGLTSLDGPARTAVIVTLVDRSSFLAANVLRQLLQQLALVAGPAVAGVLIALFARHFAIVYWLDVLSTLAALQAVVRLPPLLPGSGGRKFGIRSVAEGISFVRRQRAILICFVVDFNANVFGMPTALFPYVAAVHFHSGPETFGLLTAAPGVGALLGSFMSGWTQRVRRVGRAVFMAVAVWGGAIALFGLSPWLWPALVLLMIAGWADVISATFRTTISQLRTPPEMQGRLSALQGIVVQSGPRLGNAEAAFVAALSSAPISIVSGGLACLVAVGALARFFPDFVRLESDRGEHSP